MISGRSNDDYETVVSYGRRKREYNVLDSKILSHSVKIRVPDFEKQIDQQYLNYANQLNNAMNKLNESDRSFLINQYDEQQQKDKNKVQINYLINELGHFCFEPTQIAALSGFTLIIQGLFFSIAIILFYKTRFEEKTRKYEISF